MLYELLLFVHILAAIGWIGGAFLINLLGSRAVRSGDPARMLLLIVADMVFKPGL